MIRRFSIQRGRATNLSQFNPGSATVVLDNRDNRFSPNQTTHFYDSTNNRSKVQPLKRIRIKGAFGGTTYIIFSGFVENFPANYPGQGSDAEVKIKCIDAFKLFNNTTLDALGWNLGISTLGVTTRLTFTQAQGLSSVRVKNILDSFGGHDLVQDFDPVQDQLLIRAMEMAQDQNLAQVLEEEQDTLL